MSPATPGWTSATAGAFQQLMRCEDQDLFAWFLRRERSDDEELSAIVSTVLGIRPTAPEDR